MPDRCRSSRLRLALPALLSLCALLLLATPARAEDGWRTKIDFGVRSVPIGLSLFNDTGYRKMLSDSESLLPKNTYVEGGLHTITSPAYFRTGGYLELVPLSILQLRSNVQYTRYYGTFGFILIPDQDDPSWTLDDLGLDGSSVPGTPANVLFVETQATPRIKIDRIVAIANLTHVYIRSSVDQIYYDPYYDLLLSPTNDHILAFKPMLGYLPVANDNTYLLTALRYEKTHAFGQDLDSDLLALVGVWGLPKRWIKGQTADLTLLLGYWLDHPEERQGTTYVAFKISATFGAK